MKQKISARLQKMDIKLKIAILFLLALIPISDAIFTVTTPKRSVAAYCKVYTQEKARIAKLPGDTYPSLLFDHPQNDASEFAVSLGRLEKVAPDDIRPDIATLKSLYEKLHKDPSQMTSVSFAAGPVDESLNNWTKAHCEAPR